jgi:hypothetical protein
MAGRQINTSDRNENRRFQTMSRRHVEKCRLNTTTIKARSGNIEELLLNSPLKAKVNRAARVTLAMLADCAGLLLRDMLIYRLCRPNSSMAPGNA